MPQLPDSIRPYAAGLAKYHFWILAAMVPLLMLPALFSANGGLQKVISAKKAEIDGHFTALNAVRNEPDHPNDRWSETIAEQVSRVREELLQEWQLVWESQEPLRVWPARLGDDFLTAIDRVESGNRTDLPQRFLQRYQNTVPELVRLLPERMGCKEMMAAEGAVGGEGFRGPMPGGPGSGLPGEMGEDETLSRSLDPLIWSPADQKRLIQSFTWDQVPSTTKVVLAQEELWVYGLLCDVIHTMNEAATGRFDSSIIEVEELAVGYPAAEENPGGQGTQRVMLRRGPTLDPLSRMGEEGLPMMEPGMGAEMSPGGGPQGRPVNPRFADSAGGRLGGGYAEGPRGGPPPGGGLAGFPGAEGAEESGPQLSPDEALKHWIYVDFEGRPIRAEQLGTSPDAQMFHLVPFTLRVVMNQRRLDALLAELAAQTVPIDVRQVRLNPAGGGESGGRAGGQGESGSGLARLLAKVAAGRNETPGEQRRRSFDVTVELRGTIGLATRPREEIFTDAAAADGFADGGGF